MCGIVGIFSSAGERDMDRALLARMNETQHHRGPNEGGLYNAPGIGLGHRRLSIIDLSSGQQPLFNEDGSVVVVFNGEIYNFRTLMTELAALGHVFRTHSDTEVIVHAWDQWGEACVRRFRGMFAFALWDSNRKALFLARDHLGVKPLHYALLGDGTLLFGSELKSILVHPALSRQIDPLAVEDYFAYGYIPEPRTIFASARKLSAGHTLTMAFGDVQPRIEKFWDVPFSPHAPASEAEIGEELLARLSESVSSQLVSDVPLGAFLSGGVDSSAVVAMMAQLSDEPVTTCSIGFDCAAYDESAYAAQVAGQYRTRHHVETVASDNYDLIDTLSRLYDEPYADSSAIPTYRVCELARKNVTVVLSGDGGDENFAGYRRYRLAMAEHRIRSVFPAKLRGPIFGFLGHYYPKADWAPRIFRAKTTFEALSANLIDGYFHGVSIMPDRMRKLLFTERFQSNLQGYRAVEVMHMHASQAPTDDPLSVIQYLDMKTYLPGDILTKVDRASMAHALEVRVPLLDHQFVEWISGLAPCMKLQGSEGKYIFKKALEPHLPDAILYRKKMGFSIPLAHWFRGPLRQRVRDAILGPALADMEIFNMAYLKELVDQHQSGRSDHSAPIWSLLMFEAFLRNVLGHDKASARIAA